MLVKTLLRSLVILIGAVAGLGLTGASTKEAAADVILCNEREQPIRYAMIFQTGILAPLVSEWEAVGWYEIAPGCHTILEGRNKSEVVLSLLTVWRSGKATIKHFNLGRRAASDRSFGIERFYCVKGDTFARKTQTLAEHERCPEGYYHQLFNMYIDVPADTKYTLGLQ